MKFSEFLISAKKKSFWQSHRVICFRSKTFPVLFFHMLFNFLKEKEIINVTHLHVEQKLQLWETLQQSFLGETSFYWLGDIVENIKKSKGKKTEPCLIEVLSHYRGPHSVACFVSSEYSMSAIASKRMLVVQVPEELYVHEIMQLFSFFILKLSHGKQKLIKDLFHDTKHVTLDTCCMLSHYLFVTHVRFIDDLKKNLVAMVHPELSLNVLAHLFFTKQDKKFFSLWAHCYNNYTVPFWTVFWSEQLWKASHVVAFLKQSNLSAARRFSYRLPASFVKGDWRHCKLSELKRAYNMIYDIDFAFKKGSTFCSLDLFYSNYFLGKWS